jgi:hypothetical protein
MKRYATLFAGWLGMMAFAMTVVGAVRLGNPARIGSQLQFTVTGESNASYIIEGSTNLQQWRPVLSSRESGVTRTVSVNATETRSYYRARVARPFAGALAARDYINLQGNNVSIDSFDSASTNYSTAGRYDPVKHRDGGDVAAFLGLTNSLNVGNVKIYGKLWTGPGGSAVIGPQGGIGSIAFVDNPINTGMIQPGWLRDDMDPYFADATVPSLGVTFTPSSGGSVGGTNYAYVLGNENYRILNFSMNTGTIMVTGRATFWIQRDLNIGGTAKIVITPTGSLTLYLGTSFETNTTTIIAGGGIVNQTYRALGFQYCGLPSNTSVSLTGTGHLAGTIYAPNAALTLNSGGGAFEDFSGAIVSKSITMNVPLNFHYDENLAQSGPLF